MSQCLVTRLLGTVNDDTLEKIGVVAIKFKVTSASQKGLPLALFAPCVLTTDSSVSIYIGSSSSAAYTGQEYEVQSDGVYWLKPASLNTVVTVRVTNKYTSMWKIGEINPDSCEGIEVVSGGEYMSILLRFSAMGGSVVDLDIFKHSVLDLLYVQNGAHTKGSLSSLAGNRLTRLTLDQTDGSGISGTLNDVVAAVSGIVEHIGMTNAAKVTGNIVQLAGIRTLESLSLYGCASVVGTVESFLEGWYQGSKTYIYLNLPINVTLNGRPLGSVGWVGSASKSSGTLTLKNAMNDTLATYNGSTWTYTS